MLKRCCQKFKRSNYFDDPTKLFSNLCPAKFLDVSAKSFFSYTKSINYDITSFEYLIDKFVKSNFDMIN